MVIGHGGVEGGESMKVLVGVSEKYPLSPLRGVLHKDIVWRRSPRHTYTRLLRSHVTWGRGIVPLTHREESGRSPDSLDPSETF